MSRGYGETEPRRIPAWVLTTLFIVSLVAIIAFSSSNDAGVMPSVIREPPVVTQVSRPSFAGGETTGRVETR